MRIFAKEWVRKLLDSAGRKEGIPIAVELITAPPSRTAQKGQSRQNIRNTENIDRNTTTVMNSAARAVYGNAPPACSREDQGSSYLEDYVSAILGDMIKMNIVHPKTHAEYGKIKG